MSLPGLDCEFIISDNAPPSVESEALQIDFPGYKFVSGPGLGPGANRNHAARFASGEWLFFVDDDCVPRPNWLREITSANLSEHDVVEGMIVVPEKRDSIFRRDVENLTGGNYWSANIGMRHEFYTRLGGFDEDFLGSGGDDMEFAHRFMAAGARAAFFPSIVVEHPSHVLTWRGLLKFNFGIRWAALYLLKTNQTLPPDTPLWKATWHTATGRVANMARVSVRHVRNLDSANWRTVVARLMLDWALLPFILPYYTWWDIRFRLRLRERT